jgi:magnesium chelatase family protein
MQATALTFTLVGLDAHPIRVEVDSGRGVANFLLVGLAEASVRESRVRVRAALQQIGVDLGEYVITVNLGPADLKKSGGAFDVAIAAATLGALGKIPAEALVGVALLGELSLTGAVRPVRGVLPALRGAVARGVKRAVVPRDNAREAAAVPGITVGVADHLSEILRHFQMGAPLDGPGEPPSFAPVFGPASVDLADVRGQHGARRALEVAAAGGHNVIFMGPPGAGEPVTSDPRGARGPPPLPATTVISRRSPTASCCASSATRSFAGKARDKTNSVRDTTFTENSCERLNSWKRTRWYSGRVSTRSRSFSR